MKKEKSVSESLLEMFDIASQFVEIMRINKIKSHFDISGDDPKLPVVSELKIKFYQPYDEALYCLKTKYTHIIIGDITIGQYGSVAYKLSETSKSIDEKTKTAKEVLSALKLYSFGSMYEMSLLDVNNKIKFSKIAVRKAEKEKKLLVETINSYK